VGVKVFPVTSCFPSWDVSSGFYATLVLFAIQTTWSNLDQDVDEKPLFQYT